jgi:agmatine deiminase
MITDNECNTLYLSSFLSNDFTGQTDEIVTLVQEHGYKVKILDETDDYWCRDYMPIQLTDVDFVQFVYRPGRYHRQNELEYISNPIKIGLANRLKKPRYSRVILDGGNIVRSKETAIITDRVFEDNIYQFFDNQSIINHLKSDLSAQIVIIPQYPGDKTGHADGLIRFVDEKTVLINKIKGETETAWLEQFLGVLERFGLKYLEIPCAANENDEKASGLYINYLEIGNLIVVPQFGIESDQEALREFNDIFGQTHHIKPLKASWIGEYGGVFNCISWCIKS